VVVVGDGTTVVDVYVVVGPGVTTVAGTILPMAGALTHEIRTTADTINSRNVSVGARKLDLKMPIS